MTVESKPTQTDTRGSTATVSPAPDAFVPSTSAPRHDAGVMKKKAKHAFEKWADRYDKSLLQHYLFQPSYLVFMEEIARWRLAHPGLFTTLDIGCGTGELASLLARSDWPVLAVGLDYAPNMCIAAAAKVEGAPWADRAQFTAGDSEHLPFADGAFDLVTCSNSFHHYPHQQAVVDEVFRILRPGGMFILIDGFRDNAVGWFVFDVVIAHVEKNVHHAPWSQIDGYFRQTGFKEIRRRKFNVWMPLCATIGVKPAG